MDTQAIPPATNDHQASAPCVLSIIILTYNTVQLTLECLRSIKRSMEVGGIDPSSFEIIVVDNASTDTTAAECTLFFRSSNIDGKVIGSVVNSGFSAGNNQGIMSAKGRFTLLLNSDTLFGKKTLSQLLLLLKESQQPATILAAALRNADGSFQPQGGDLPYLFPLFCFALMLDDLPWIGKLLPSTQHTGKRAVNLTKPFQKKGWVAGTAMVFPTALPMEIGLLDEAIFMYAEDIEFCWRAKKAGYDIAELRDIQIVHLGSASSGSAAAIKGEFTSLAYVCRKHLPKWKSVIAIWLIRVAIVVRKLVFKLTGNKPRLESLQGIRV